MNLVFLAKIILAAESCAVNNYKSRHFLNLGVIQIGSRKGSVTATYYKPKNVQWGRRDVLIPHADDSSVSLLSEATGEPKSSIKQELDKLAQNLRKQFQKHGTAGVDIPNCISIRLKPRIYAVTKSKEPTSNT